MKDENDYEIFAKNTACVFGQRACDVHGPQRERYLLDVAMNMRRCERGVTT
ncbi:MAG: hypothetical protein ACREVE_08480 [Gammaproteobacteria bacterium]